VVKSGTVLQYTDSFPSEVTLSLAATPSSNTSKPVTGPAGSVYLCVELDFSIQAGVSVSYQQGIYGLSGTASSSDTFTVAFYKNCKPGDLLGQSIARAFGDLVLPFHSNTLKNLQAGDFLSHTANANLQLGLGANIGFKSFSFADQWKSGIPGVANSPTLSVGISPVVQPTVKLAYSFSYAGTFEQLLWVDAAGAGHLHLYRSKTQISSLDLTAGITADANATAATAVQTQIANAPQQAAPQSGFATALTTVFNAFSAETSKLSSDIDSKINALLKPINTSLQVTLDMKIAQTNQNYLLLDYTVNLANPAWQNVWTLMCNGRFVDALAQSNGSVQLDPGSGLEQLYNKTASISLNFFGQWAGNWSTAQIASSSLIYAGNNTFHLVTVEGMQKLSTINKSSTEVDFYFAAEMDLSGAAPTLQPPNLNVMLRATNNKAFGDYIASFVGYLTSGQDGQALTTQVRNLAQSANTTQVLQLIFQPSAYGNLKSSTIPLTPGGDAADSANYGAFEQACATIMTSSPANFSSGPYKLSYEAWSNWNIASNNAWPAPAGALPNRKEPGDVGGGGAQSCVTDLFGINAPVGLLTYAFESASGFMNLCEDLKILATQPVDQKTWQDFVDSLLALIRRDVTLDFVAPATLALSRCCSGSGPQTTIGPAPGLAGNTSIGVKMTFA
jgi:hypothetical protein